MSLMEWSDDLSVGVDQFDDEHKKLINIINELFESMRTGRAQDALGSILNQLVDYTKTHFANEEQAMQEAGYSGYAAHKAKHDALTQRVAEVQKKYQSGAKAILTIEVMNFLKSWLVEHIQGEDKKYASALSGTQVGA